MLLHPLHGPVTVLSFKVPLEVADVTEGSFTNEAPVLLDAVVNDFNMVFQFLRV